MVIGEQSCKYTMVRAEKIRCSNNLGNSGAVFTVQGSPQLYSHSVSSNHPSHHSQQCEHTVHVLDSNFEVGTGICAVQVSAYHVNINSKAKFTNVSIVGSHSGFGMLIKNVYLGILDRIFCKGRPIQIIKSEITMHNAFVEEVKGIQGSIAVWKSQVTFLGSTIFLRNDEGIKSGSGALYAEGSTLKFQGTVEFMDNTGYNGGALALYEGSKIVIESHAHLKFIGNHAKHLGGAIYVNNANYHMLSNFKAICFYKLTDTFNTSMKPYVVFENNTADYAGSTLYGGYVDFCGDPNTEPGYSDFDSLFQVSGRESDSSVIASNPLRVCLCVDSRPECIITQYNISAYPGTTIQIPAVAVGQRFGTVPSTVHSGFLYELMDGIHPEIKDWQHTQKVDKHCTELMYTVMSPSQVKLTMKVEVESLDSQDMYIMELAIDFNNSSNRSMTDLYVTNLQINVKILPCPLGFQYDNTSMMCTCDSKLLEHGLNCSIDTQTVWRKNSFWITTAEESGEVLVHEHCPFDYCKPESFDLDLEDPDEQCAFHRSGILCGACQHNLSHVFGTSACRECLSLWALLWVPVIALAGIALVVLLIVLNLTVSLGTINGLIFYANIVRANHATFFPPNTINSFLSWFIAWINLDLGMETCFYNELDTYMLRHGYSLFPTLHLVPGHYDHSIEPLLHTCSKAEWKKCSAGSGNTLPHILCKATSDHHQFTPIN